MLPGFTGFLPRYFQLFWVFFSVNRFVELTQHLTRPPSTSSDWCVGGGVKKWNENWRQMKSSRPRPPTGAGTSSFFFSSYSFPFWRPPPQNLARTTKKKTSQGGGVGGGAWPHRGPLFSPYLLVPIKKKKKIKKQPLTHRHKQNGDFFPNFRFPRFSLLFFLFFFLVGGISNISNISSDNGRTMRQRERERERVPSQPKSHVFLSSRRSERRKILMEKKNGDPPPFSRRMAFLFVCVCVCVFVMAVRDLEFTEFYRVFLGFFGWHRVLLGFTEFFSFSSLPLTPDWSIISSNPIWRWEHECDWSVLGLIRFYRVLPSFTEFYRVFLGFFGLYPVLLGFTKYYRVLPSFSPSHLFLLASIGWYWVFTKFYWVLTQFYHVSSWLVDVMRFYRVLLLFLGILLGF